MTTNCSQVQLNGVDIQDPFQAQNVNGMNSSIWNKTWDSCSYDGSLCVVLFIYFIIFCLFYACSKCVTQCVFSLLPFAFFIFFYFLFSARLRLGIQHSTRIRIGAFTLRTYYDDQRLKKCFIFPYHIRWEKPPFSLNYCKILSHAPKKRLKIKLILFFWICAALERRSFYGTRIKKSSSRERIYMSSVRRVQMMTKGSGLRGNVNSALFAIQINFYSLNVPFHSLSRFLRSFNVHNFLSQNSAYFIHVFMCSFGS